MKKLTVLLIAALLAVGFVGAAETSSGSLVVNGSVTGYTLLSVTDSPILVTFNGTGAAGTPDRTANLNLKANRTAWTVTFDSANDGLLVSPTAGVEATSKIPYKVQATLIPAVGFTFTGTNQLSSAVQLTEPKKIEATSAGRTPKAGINYTLTVSAIDQADADILWQADTAYTDTITISVTQG